MRELSRMIHFNNILQYTYAYVHSPTFPTKTLKLLLISPIYVAIPASLAFPSLIILIMYGEEYKLSRSIVMHYSPCPFTSHVFSLNILLSTLLTVTNNLRSSLNP